MSRSKREQIDKMAANPRFKINASATDGALFAAGYSNNNNSNNAKQGDFFGSPSAERNPSFRESREGISLIQSNGGHPRELFSLAQKFPSLDFLSFGEQNYAQQVELKRAINAAVGRSAEDTASGNLLGKPLDQCGPEEIKRIKASLQENLTRARDRSHCLAKEIAKHDRFRPPMQPRKRMRPEPSSHERPSASLPMEKSAAAGNSLKSLLLSSPNRINSFEAPSSKVEDKKRAVPSKRSCTSTVEVRLDGRPNVPVLHRSVRGTTRECEDKGRDISTTGEGWKKNKLKGRRSGKKADTAIKVSAAIPTGIESKRDHKWGGQHILHRLATDGSRSRPRAGHGFRSGPVHGFVSMHKIENSSQHNTIKGDTSGPASKISMKPLNEEEISKSKVARAPRTSPIVHSNRSQMLQASPSPQSDNWLNKAQVSSRKRPAANEIASSLPIGGFHIQLYKKARGARRKNLVSPVGGLPLSSKDETVNTVEDVPPIHDSNAARSNMGISVGLVAVRRVVSTGTVSQNKAKGERAKVSNGLSENEESEGGNAKSIEKSNSEDGFSALTQKKELVSSPSKKSLTVSKDGGIDSGHRQGRSGRTAIHGRVNAVLPLVESLDASVNAKMRTTKTGPEKPDHTIELNLGLLKKNASAAKMIARPQGPAGNVLAELSGEEVDDREEIRAAVQATPVRSAAACSSAFWKDVRKSDLELLNLKVKIIDEGENLTLTQKDGKMDVKTQALQKLPNAISGCRTENMVNGSSEADNGPFCKAFSEANDKFNVGKDHWKHHCDGWVNNLGLLSQRLLAALITSSDLLDSDKGNDNFRDPADCTRDVLVKGMGGVRQAGGETDIAKDLDTRGDKRRCNGWSSDACLTSNGHRQRSQSFNMQSNCVPESCNILAHPENEICSHIRFSEAGKGNTNCWESENQCKELEEKIYLELQSIALLPETVPDFAKKDDDEIGNELKKIHEGLKSQACSNKERIESLEKMIMQNKETEERERECLTMAKLVEISYDKHVETAKDSTSKTANSASSSFAKRTLARLKEFQETGQSSIPEPGPREMLFCSQPKERETKTVLNQSEIRDACTTLRLPDLKSADNAEWLACGIPSEANAERETSERNCSKCKEKEVVGGNNNLFDGVKGKCGEKEKKSNDVIKEGIRQVDNNKSRRQKHANAKRQRKPKAKPKEKTLSKADVVQKETPLVLSSAEEDGVKKESSPSSEAPIDLSHLPLPAMEDFSTDPIAQNEDLRSWLDFEHTELKDIENDFVGLAIPNDDLADLGENF